MKDSIKIILSTEQKKQIKRQALESDKTISKYVLDLIFEEEKNAAETPEQRIAYITEQLQKYGGSMSAEQRAELKNEKKALLNGIF